MSSCFKPLEDLVNEEDEESKDWFIKRIKEQIDKKIKEGNIGPDGDKVVRDNPGDLQ